MIALRTRLGRYLVAGVVSVLLVGSTLLSSDLSGVEGPAGYFFLVVVVGYVFATASDRVRRSPYYPFLTAGSLLTWGGYDATRGRRGLLTVVLLVGGAATIVWEGYELSTGRQRRSA